MGSPLGDRGEALAAERLEAEGWQILDRNYRVGRREVDLVARRGEVVAFVEVKTRRSGRFGHPLEAITRHKQREIAAVADAWIAAHGRAGEVYRFDAIAITFAPDTSPRVEHLEDAWGV
ncbi:MAG TPA: YraN family protein [Longimicrobiaceae bacterium]